MLTLACWWLPICVAGANVDGVATSTTGVVFKPHHRHVCNCRNGKAGDDDYDRNTQQSEDPTPDLVSTLDARRRFSEKEKQKWITVAGEVHITEIKC